MPSAAESMFDAAAELGRVVSERHRIERQDAKDARNARRRQRYAATKHLPKPTRSTIVAGSEWGNEDDWEATCTCYRSAPCHHCTTSDEA
jgi:hypothetical protein